MELEKPSKTTTLPDGTLIEDYENGFSIEYPPDPTIVTIITASNPALHAKLRAVVDAEYGETVTGTHSVNGFGNDLSRYSPRGLESAGV